MVSLDTTIDKGIKKKDLTDFRYHYSITVTKIVDADTLYCDVDLGFSTIVKSRLRLYGINAYEKHDPDPDKRALAKQGIEYVTDVLRLNSRVIIHTHKDETEKYGRYLAVIYYCNDSIESICDWHNLNQELIDEGLAVSYLPKNVKLI